MARGKKTKKNKVHIFKEIFDQLHLEWKPEYSSTGSSVTGQGLEQILLKVAQITGNPPKGLTKEQDLTWRLLNKSQESFVLALENINKVTITYRLESFLFLIVVAWEMLLKARLLDSGKTIYYNEDTDRTFDLKKCVRKIFKENSPEYDNLYQIDDLRNEAVHLFINVIPPLIMSLFQASILNYKDCLLTWFGRDINENIPEGMLFLVSDIDPTRHSTAALSKKLSQESFDFLTTIQQNIISKVKRYDDSELGRYIQQIDVNYSYVRNPKKADFIVRYDDKGPGVMELTREKDLDDTHPYLTKNVIEILNKRGIEVNNHILGKVLPVVYKTKEEEKFCKIPKHHTSSPQYSNTFIQWIMEECEKDPDFFEKASERYRELKRN